MRFLILLAIICLGLLVMRPGDREGLTPYESCAAQGYPLSFCLRSPEPTVPTRGSLPYPTPAFSNWMRGPRHGSL